MPALAPIVEKLPMDWVILGLFAVIVTIITLRVGTQYAVALSLAAPLTVFIYSALPWTAFVGGYTDRLLNPAVQAVAVGLILMAFLALIYRMMPSASAAGAFPIQAVLAGLATAIVFMVMLLQFPPLAAFINPSPLMHTVFGPAYNIFWLLGAYIALAVARR